jgi:hypothetical protein
MAQLNPSNIQNGNIIQANDVIQLYDALTSGGGYNVSISGSLTGSASTATTATTANTANITLASQTFYIDLEGNGTTNFRSITGISNPLSSGTVVVDISDIPSLPTQLGVDIFVTASPSGSLSSPIQIDYGDGDITFTTQDTASTSRVLFTGWIV